MKYKRSGPTTGSTLPGGSDVGTLGRLEQLAVRGGVGVGLAINVFGVIIGHQVVDVLVVGRVHVWVRRRYQVVPPDAGRCSSLEGNVTTTNMD